MSNFDGIVISINGLEIPIQQGILNWIIVCTFVMIFLAIIGNKFKKADPSQPPKGLVLLGETIYNLALSVIGDNLSSRKNRYLSFFGTLMVVMCISNLFGLLGVQAPTSNLSLNMTLAIMMFILIQFTAIKELGFKQRVKDLCEPMVLLSPLNLIGEIALPISLAFRLFGNILGGTIIVALVYMLFHTMVSLFAPLAIVGYLFTPLLHAYFDVFAGIMQTYIFFTLASYFLGSNSGFQED